MMDITVKTLDGQNRNYSIPENMTVRKFKEKIANSINISADVQRLIFQGRVMQDDKPLKEYDIHGKVIHVVERPPPGAAPPRASGATSSPPNTDHENINSIVNLVEQAVSNMGDMGRNARVSTRSSADGSAVDVRIHLAHVPAEQVESEAQLRLNNVRRMLRLARETLDRLENPLRTNGGQETSGTDTAASTSGPTGSVIPPTDSATPQAVDPENTTVLSSTISPSATLMDSTENQSSQSQEQPDQSEQSANTSTASPDVVPSSEQGRQSGSSTQTQTGQRRGPNRPRLIVLAEVLSEILEINARLQPHLERYQQLMEDDPELEQNEVEEPQRVCNLVSEVLHSLSHCYHSVSDIMADLSQPRPRQLYATLAATVSMPAAIIQQTMPIQAHINVANPHLVTGPLSHPANTQGDNQAQTPTRNVPSTASTQSAAVNTNTQTSGPQRQTTGTASGAPLLSSHASTDPYVFVEVGPDSVTVNSISAQYMDSDSTTAASSTTETTNAGTTSTPSTPMVAHQEATPTHPHGTNLPPTLVQNIVQSMLQAHMGQGGLRPGVPHHFTVNGQFHGFVRPPAGAGASSATPTAQNVRNSAGTQTQTFRSQTATSGPQTLLATSDTNTSGTQTRQTPVNTSGTQTQGNRQNPLNNSGTQTQGHPRAIVVPGMPGIMGTRPVDPYLPCSSRHFLTHQARNLASHPPTQNSETALADMVTDLMSGLLGQPNPHIQVSNGSTAPSTPQSTSQASTNQTAASTSAQLNNTLASVFSGGTFGSSPGGTTEASPGSFVQSLAQCEMGRGEGSGEPQFVNMLRNLLQSSSSLTEPVRPTQPTATPPTEQAAMSDETFTQLVRGISQNVTQSAVGQAPTETISQFLNNLGDNYNIVPGEGFLNDLFQCILSHLTFQDLMQVFFGNPEALNRIESPLQDFIRERVLEGKQPTPNNIEQGVEKLIQDMEVEIQEVVNESDVKSNIDMVATLKKFTRHQLKTLVQVVMGIDDSGTDQSFGQCLNDCVRRCIGELIVLCRRCLTGGMPALETLIQTRLRNMTSGINPMIQQWLLSMASQQLSSFVPTITVPEEDVCHYVVSNTMPAAGPARSVEEAPMEIDSVASSPGPSVDKVNKSNVGLSKSVVTEVPCSSSGSAVNGANSTLRGAAVNGANSTLRGAAVNGANSTLRGAAVNGAEPTVKVARDLTAVAASADEEWQSVIPAEWVPIIAHDIQRQKQQAPQTPFSDGYLQGMPAKRRKIMTQDKSRDLSNAADVVPELLHQAVAAAGVEPISSMENLASEASNNAELHSAFDEQISDTLANRLERDTDFRAERFPNSDEYYHKKTNKK